MGADEGGVGSSKVVKGPKKVGSNVGGADIAL